MKHYKIKDPEIHVFLKFFLSNAEIQKSINFSFTNSSAPEYVHFDLGSDGEIFLNQKFFEAEEYAGDNHQSAEWLSFPQYLPQTPGIYLVSTKTKVFSAFWNGYSFENVIPERITAFMFTPPPFNPEESSSSAE